MPVTTYLLVHHTDLLFNPRYEEMLHSLLTDLTFAFQLTPHNQIVYWDAFAGDSSKFPAIQQALHAVNIRSQIRSRHRLPKGRVQPLGSYRWIEMREWLRQTPNGK